MKTPPLKKETYLRWARETARLKMPEPTMAEAMASERILALTLSPTHEGVILRAANHEGGSIELQLNAAQVIHLMRSLQGVGQAAGWLDHNGNPVTSPATSATDDTLAAPPHGPT